ncbi:MAG TPA: NAD(P)-dependent oxidoreductase [Xanthobacteraceae bacterium]|nr:NAD(P)-dependent oxidoreductase [Xanthobacteraceae bacterium]
MRVLVTGASGFIGRHTLPALTQLGCEVVASARRPGPPAPGVEWIAADLLAPGETKRLGREARADALLHLAWTVEHDKFWTDPANLDWVGASLRLVRAAVEAGTRRVCITGTCFEYDWPSEGDCVERVTALRAHTLYDACKASCRQVLEAYAAQTGLSFAWARLFHLYGPHENAGRLVSSIARALVAGTPARTSRGLTIRDFMDIRDVGAALARLVASDVHGPVNIATGKGTPIADIAAILGRLAARPDLTQIGALPDRPDDPPRIVADVTRLRREVGVEAPRSLEQGLSEALDFWREVARS